MVIRRNTDIADVIGSWGRGSSTSKNFVVGTGQTLGPFIVNGNHVTIQASPRPNYVSGTLPTVSYTVQGSLDGIFWYPIVTNPSPVVSLGLVSFDAYVPYIRVVGDFGAAAGTLYIYSVR